MALSGKPEFILNITFPTFYISKMDYLHVFIQLNINTKSTIF